jgi:VanZ family protein
VAEGISPHSGGTVPDSHRVPSPLARLAATLPWSPVASRWLPVLVWAAVIFAFSSIPSLNSGLGGWDYVLRKCAHMTEYAILALLLLRATGSATWAAGLAVAYAATDEIHQTFVRGRHGSPVDVAIDAVGVAVALAAARVRSRHGA